MNYIQWRARYDKNSKKPDIRRQELLDIGVKLFFEAGEKEISIQEVVKQANVATGLFFGGDHEI